MNSGDRPDQQPASLDDVILDCLRAVAPEADAGALRAEKPFRDQLEIDSIDFLNFVLGLEKRLGLKVPEMDFPQLSTLDGCRAYLSARAGAR